MSQHLVTAYNLSDEYREKFTVALGSLAHPRSMYHENWVRSSREAARDYLPSQILHSLDEMRNDVNPPGAMIINNLPVDPVLPPTPADGYHAPDHGTLVAESCLVGVSALLGEPYTFKAEKSSLAHHVVPNPSARKELSNRGHVELPWHTELAGLDHRASFIVLYGLRSDHLRQAYTSIADVRAALDLLSPSEIRELRLKQFRTLVPTTLQSVQKRKLRHWSGVHAVLDGPLSAPEVRAALYGGLTKAKTPAGEKALRRLGQALTEVEVPVLLDRGTMVVVNNRLVLHKRTEYTPRFDGTDRWFLRSYVADTLWPLREHAPNSPRVIEF